MTFWEVVLLTGLVVLTALLSMARSSLINVRQARLRQLVDEGVKPAQAAEKLAENASQLLATTQLGMTLACFFAGATVAVLSAPTLAKLWQPWLGGASYPVAFTVVVLLAALVMLILGELVPETVALQHSERLALWLARPLMVLSAVTMPLVRLTVGLSNAISRLLGAEAQGSMPFVTEEEIKTLVDAGEEEGVIEKEEKRMIYSIFELGDTLVRQIMVPRIDVVAVEATTPMLEALDVIMEAGHSRIPVYEDTIDNVVGVLYAKDLLCYLRDGRTDVPLRNLIREPYFIPETKKAGDLLPDLQQRRVHMAIVVDEYGGMAGLVTIEDLLEEIVGEIQDEYDTEEPFMEVLSENEYLFDARIDLDAFNQLMDASLPTEETDSLGGFIYSQLGKVPVVGDQVTYDDLVLTVESVVSRRIKKVRIQRQPSLLEETEEDDVTDPSRNGRGQESPPSPKAKAERQKAHD